MQERSQTEENQQLVISPPGTSAETVQIRETDTLPVKTMTELQSAPPGTNSDETTFQSMERVPQEVVKPERAVGSSGDTDNNLYCVDKLRSLSQGDRQTLTEVSEESIAKLLGGPIFSGGVVDESMHANVVGNLEEACQYPTSHHVMSLRSPVVVRS